MKFFILLMTIVISSVVQTVIDKRIGLKYTGSSQRIKHSVPQLLSGALIAYILFF